MRIGVDIDGVLANFNSAYIAKCIAVTGRDLFPPRPFDIVTWEFPESYGYTKAEVSAVWASIKESLNFWFSLKPYFDTQTSLEMLCARQDTYKDEVYFITARPGTEVKFQTERWLEVYAPFNAWTPTVLISSQKGMCAKALELDMYIDDRLENVYDVREKSYNTSVYLMDRTWNQTEGGILRGDITRVYSVADMFVGGAHA